MNIITSNNQSRQDLRSIPFYKEKIPNKTRCSEDKRFQLELFDKEFALQFPYIQENIPSYINIIDFDLDYEDSAFAWQAKDLQAPSLVLVNKTNGHSRYKYILEEGIPWNKKTRATSKLFYDVTGFYKDIISADKITFKQKNLCPNALHKNYDLALEGNVVSLSQMAECLEGRRYKKEHSGVFILKPFVEYVRYGRNCTLFEYGRFFGYNVTKEANSLGDLKFMILQELKVKNETDIPFFFPKPLPAGELQSIARSISKYCWNHKDYVIQKTKNVGVMGFEPRRGRWIQPELFKAETSRRQQAGALFTAEKKKIKTLEILKPFLSSGKSIREIAKETGVSKSVVWRHLNGNL